MPKHVLRKGSRALIMFHRGEKVLCEVLSIPRVQEEAGTLFKLSRNGVDVCLTASVKILEKAHGYQKGEVTEHPLSNLVPVGAFTQRMTHVEVAGFSIEFDKEDS